MNNRLKFLDLNTFLVYNMRMSIIEFSNVTFFYEDETRPALDGVSFTVEEGETVAIIGHNGSGKSTLARLANGLLLPQKGKVVVNGIETSDSKRIFEVRSTVGVVFQNPDNQMIATIIEDDIAFGPENVGMKPDEIRKRVDWALKSVGMSEYAQRAPFKLSGGQKQRVAIAGVLALKPKVMILDESTAMLDPLSRQEVTSVALSLVKEENMSLITITHFVDEAIKADKIIVLNDGKIYMQGGKEIFLQEEKLKAIGLESPLSVSVANALKSHNIQVDGTSDDNLVSSLLGYKNKTEN